jgi:hypothetical protein
MNGINRLAILAASAAGLALTAAPASAQATRTWVSGVGDDANPCSRTAPCKTFAGAISKTAAGGEINCIDPGGFGGVTITKAISIICDDVEAGVLVSGTNGITVNAGAADSVLLSGLDIHGVGTGLKGVRYLAGGALHIQNSTIQKFSASGGAGISVATSTPSNLLVSNTTILNNGNGSTGGGIEIVPTGGANSKVVLRNVLIEANANIGLNINMSGTSGGSMSVHAEQIHIVTGVQGMRVTTTGTGAAAVMFVRSTIANNFGAALTADGGLALLRVSDSTIFGNQSGITATNSAEVLSYGDNRLDGNPPTGAPNNGAFNNTISKR